MGAPERYGLSSTRSLGLLVAQLVRRRLLLPGQWTWPRASFEARHGSGVSGMGGLARLEQAGLPVTSKDAVHGRPTSWALCSYVHPSSLGRTMTWRTCRGVGGLIDHRGSRPADRIKRAACWRRARRAAGQPCESGRVGDLRRGRYHIRSAPQMSSQARIRTTTIRMNQLTQDGADTRRRVSSDIRWRPWRARRLTGKSGPRIAAGDYPSTPSPWLPTPVRGQGPRRHARSAASGRPGYDPRFVARRVTVPRVRAERVTPRAHRQVKRPSPILAEVTGAC